MVKYIWLLVFTALLSSCKDELEDPIDQAIYGYEYFPLEVGKYRTYQVDSIQFDVGSNGLPVSDSARFYLREEILESFQDQTGETIYRIERYRANQLGDPWLIYDVVTESRQVNQGYRRENNLLFINLIFPLVEGMDWDGNAFIPDDKISFIQGESLEFFKNWEYKVLSEGQSETIGSNTYDAVATIQQADSDNIIEFRFSTEKYARGIGLVFRERQILDSYCKYIGSNDDCVGKTWREKAGRGFIARETLIDHN